MFKGVAWELERTVISLLQEPAKADRSTNEPGIDQWVAGEINEPKGTRKEAGTGKVLGSEPKAKQPEMEKR